MCSCRTAGFTALIDPGSELNSWKLCVVYGCRLNCCGSATWDLALNDDVK